MIGVLTHLDVYGGWLAAVVGGLVALGWLVKRVVRVVRVTWARCKEIARKIDTLEELAGYELNSNGGGSIKDRVGKIPALEASVADLTTASGNHTERLGSLEGSLAGALDRIAALSTTQVVVTSDATTVLTEAGKQQ